jgi:DeoR family transcriptional regulator of aga operon
MPRSSITRRESITEEGERSSQGGDRQKRRFQEILKALQQNGTISVEELSASLNVTVVTIRRDLNTLEQQGLLSRTHGGAVAGHPMFYESFKNDRSFMAQVEHFAEEKRHIGRAAAELVQPGETIAVTPGTTTAEIIRCLPFNSDLTVVTNTVNIAMELSKRKDIDVFVTGGHLRGDWFSLVGPAAIQSFEKMLIHTLFIGADGLDAEWGASCHNAEEAELNNVLLSRSRRHIAVADHSKLKIVAKWRICETSSIHTLITDSGATDEMIAPFLAAGVEVVRV